MQVGPKNPRDEASRMRKKRIQGFWYCLVAQKSPARPVNTRHSISESKGRTEIMSEQSHSSDKPRGKRETEASASACRLMTNCQGENQPHINPVNCISLGFVPGGKGCIPKKSCSICKQIFFSPWDLTWFHMSVLAVVIKTSETVDGPSMGTFKARLDESLRDLIDLKMSLLIAEGWPGPLRVPCNPILWFYHV